MRARQTLARWVPALAWAPRYQLAALWSDAFAGVMVGAVVVPQVRPRGAAPKETWRAPLFERARARARQLSRPRTTASLPHTVWCTRCATSHSEWVVSALRGAGARVVARKTQY